MMRSVDSNTNMEFITDMLSHWGNDDFVDNLIGYVDSGKIVLEFPDCAPKEDMWDGTLLIHIKEEMGACEIVNKLISGTYANEIYMENNELLRLWWD